MQILRTTAIILILNLLLALELFAQKPTIEEMPLENLKPGLSCYGLTVLRGQTPQKIKLRIVGDTESPVFHEKRIILAEMQDEIRDAGGMSGTPIYCNNKILGALSYNYGLFPLKKSLVGITPISYMRDQQGSLGRRPRRSTTSSQAIGEFRPIEIPLSVSGAALGQIGRLNRELPSENFVFVQGGATESRNSSSQQPGIISPGDSVTMFLSRGAVAIGGTCTVAEVTEKTFSLCGHPFLGEGEIQLPAYRSSVAHTFQSTSRSFKVVGNILEPVGTILYDNAFAVEGVRELRPDIMIPVNFSVTVDSDHYDYQFEVFRHKFYTSMLIEMNTRFLLGNLWPSTRLGTTRLAAKIYLKGKTEPIDIYDAGLVDMQRVQLGFLEGYADPWQILGKFQQTLSFVQQSEWNFAIERIELLLDVWSGNRILMFDSMAVLDQSNKPTEEIRAGDKLTVILGMRSEDSKQKRVRKFVIEIPRDLNLVKPKNETDTSLPIILFISSGSKYQEMDPKKLPKTQQPDSAEEFIRVLHLNQRDPSEIFAVLVLPSEYQSTKQGGTIFPELKSGVWNPVDSLEFLRERKAASESRVIYLPLGTPLKDAVVSFMVRHPLKLMLK